jgi:hypothetical protein
MDLKKRVGSMEEVLVFIRAKNACHSSSQALRPRLLVLDGLRRGVQDEKPVSMGAFRALSA